MNAAKESKHINRLNMTKLLIGPFIHNENIIDMEPCETSGRGRLWGPAQGLKNNTQRKQTGKIKLKMATIGPK